MHAVIRLTSLSGIANRFIALTPAPNSAKELDDVKTFADHHKLAASGLCDIAVIITPHDDDLNVYLTIYCRQLRPDIQILSRATHERNVATLHRAGADSVLSYASMGASAVMNMLKRSKILMVAEGLDLTGIPTSISS